MYCYVVVCHVSLVGLLSGGFTDNHSSTFSLYTTSITTTHNHHHTQPPPHTATATTHTTSTQQHPLSQVLGTFITEWEAGAALCQENLFPTESRARYVAQQLAAIAACYGFEGWLINIENTLPPIENTLSPSEKGKERGEAGVIGNVLVFLRYACCVVCTCDGVSEVCVLCACSSAFPHARDD